MTWVGRTPFFLSNTYFGMRPESVEIHDAPAHGKIAASTRDSIEYLPNAGFLGDDSFTYDATYPVFDGTGTRVGSVTKNLRWSFQVELPTNLSILSDDPSADESGAAVYGYVSPQEPPLSMTSPVSFDQVGLDWKVNDTSPTGSVTEFETVTSGADLKEVLATAKDEGHQYIFVATVNALALDGGPLTPVVGDQDLGEVTIQSGAVDHSRVDQGEAKIPADGQTTTWLAITAYDQFGNPASGGPLVNDNGSSQFVGLPVQWSLDGQATLLNADGVTKDGNAFAWLKAGYKPGDLNVTVTVGGKSATITVKATPLNVSLGITGNVLTLGSTDTQVVTATVTDADGNPVKAGTPITWYSQKGTIAGDATVGALGLATATLSATGGSQAPGPGSVRAWVGTAMGASPYLWVAAPSAFNAAGFRVAASRMVIAGDTTIDETVPIEQADGTFIGYQVFAQSEFTITGTPGAVLTVAVPNLGAKFLAVQAGGPPGQSATVTLNPLGQARVTVVSLGALPPDQGIAVPISVQVEPTWWESLWGTKPPGTTINVAVMPKQVVAGTYDYVEKLAWGILSGEGTTPAEIAGDMALSMMPGVGVLTDIRDMAKELLKLRPGSQENFNWLTFSFAAFGVAGEFFKPIDAVFLAGKTLSKAGLAASGPLFAIFGAMFTRMKLSRLAELTPFVRKVGTDPNFAKAADKIAGVGVDAAADVLDDVVLGQMNALLKALPDDAAGLLTKAVSDLGPAAARRVVDLLSNLKPGQLADIKAAGQMDLVAEAIGRGLQQNSTNKLLGLSDYVKYLDDLKTNSLTKIPGASEAEDIVDKILIKDGQLVKPNLLTQEWLGGTAGRQGDRFVDGLKTDLKTISNLTGTTADKLSKQLMDGITKHRSQGEAFVVNLTDQAGMTEAIIERTAKRIYGWDDATGKKIKKLQFIFQGRIISPPRP